MKDDMRNINFVLNKTKFEHKCINRKLVTSGSAVKISEDLLNQKISTNGFDTIHLLIQSTLENMPTFIVTINYMRHGDSLGISNVAEHETIVAAPDTMLIPATTAGDAFTSTSLALNSAKLQVSEWIELTFTEPAALVTNYRYSLSVLKVAQMGASTDTSAALNDINSALATLNTSVTSTQDDIINAERIIDIMPVWERHDTGFIIATVTNAAAATYNYYVDLEGYNHFGLQGDITDAPTSIKVFGTFQNDGTAAPSITAWEDLSSIFMGGAKTTDFVATDSAGIFGSFKWVKIEVVAPLNADWILWGSRWFA